MNDADCVAFLQWALPRLSLRWSGFRKVRGQVRKRLSRRLRELSLEDLAEYRRYLESHPEEWGVLDGLCRITISRFFRDRAVFEVLGSDILPALGAEALRSSDGVLRCWSAGCASGEEPYSLSLVWEMKVTRQLTGARIHILATDIDPHLIERARIACYPPGALKEIPEGWVEEAFEPRADELCLRAWARRHVELAEQDIRTEMPDGPFQVMLCRNLVFTYFEPALQGELLSRLIDRLPERGVLVLGGHEALPPGEWPLDRTHGALPLYARTSA